MPQIYEVLFTFIKKALRQADVGIFHFLSWKCVVFITELTCLNMMKYDCSRIPYLHSYL